MKPIASIIPFFATLLVNALLVAAAAPAKLPPEIRSTLFGCQLSTDFQVEFDCDANSGGNSDPLGRLSFWYCSCSYDPKIVTLMHCFKKFASHNINETLNGFSQYCQHALEWDQPMTVGEYWSKYENGSQYLVQPANSGENAISSNEDDDETYQTKQKHKYNVPVILNDTITTVYRSDMLIFEENYDRSTFSGKVVALYWTIVFACFTIYHRIIHNNSISILNRYRSFNHLIVNKFLKQYVTIPNTSPKYHQEPFRYKGTSAKVFKIIRIVFQGLVPTRLETIILTGYVLLNLYLLIADYSVKSESFLFVSQLSQILRFMSDRSGIIAVDHIPILVLLAGRNSILTWGTGLPYSSLIVFHKWVSRGMVFNAMIHSIGYVVISLNRHHLWLNISEERYFLFGIVATVAGTILIIQAIYYLRSQWYETFLVLHIMLAVLFLIGMVYHCLEVGWLGYVVVSIVVWIFDRLVRLYRIYKFGICDTATIELVSDTTLKLSVPMDKGHKSNIFNNHILNKIFRRNGIVSNNWKPFPGCYVFAYFWLPSCFWQSHPFCLIEEVKEGDDGGRTVVLYIQVKDGITRKLFNYAVTQAQTGIGSNKVIIRGSNIAGTSVGSTFNNNNEIAVSLDELKQLINKPVPISVSLEGPYGDHHIEFAKYSKIIFIAGGSGIPGPYYHLIDILRKRKRFQNNKDCLINGFAQQDLQFYWSNRYFKDMRWFIDELSQLKDEDVKIELFLTREKDLLYLENNTVIPYNTNTNTEDIDITSSKNGHTIITHREAPNHQNKIVKVQEEDNTSQSRESLDEMYENSDERTALLSATTPIPTTTLISPSKQEDRGIYAQLQHFANIHCGERPNVREIISQNCHLIKNNERHSDNSGLLDDDDDELDEGVNSGRNYYNKSMAIVYCGPSVMCDDVRNAVSEMVGQTKEVVDIFEELQVW